MLPIGIVVGVAAIFLAIQIWIDMRNSTDTEPLNEYLADDITNNGSTVGTTTATSTSMDQNISSGNGLIISDTKVGTGKEAKNGDTVVVNYTGKFTNGQTFDSSVGKAPFEFTIGAGQVITGWEMGVQGMKEGGTRRLSVPPELGYGAADYGPIPGNSTLLFEVELISVK